MDSFEETIDSLILAMIAFTNVTDSSINAKDTL